MKTQSTFIYLFSDEAATPSPGFVRSLETRFVNSSLSPVTNSRHISPRTKILLAVVATVIIAAILALVLLPKRDMSDASKDSLIESVITTSQGNTKPFTATTEKADVPKNTSANTQGQSQPSQQQVQIAPNTSTPLTSPPAQQPLAVTGFTAEFWNLVSESAGGPSMPASAPDYYTTTGTIQYNWTSSSSPATGVINTDLFVARFTKNSADLQGQYKVTYSSDNGLRMQVNETVVFDKWNAASTSGVAYFTTDPASPVTSISIEYYEAYGPASVSVEITKL